MARESSLWAWLKRARLKLRYELHMERIENTAASGTPDVEGHYRSRSGKQFWIELKSVARPKRDGIIKFRIRSAQVEWLRRRCYVGGRAWLFVQVGSGAAAKRYLLWGTHAAEMREGVTEDWLRAKAHAGPFTHAGTIQPTEVIQAASDT